MLLETDWDNNNKNEALLQQQRACDEMGRRGFFLHTQLLASIPTPMMLSVY